MYKYNKKNFTEYLLMEIINFGFLRHFNEKLRSWCFDIPTKHWDIRKIHLFSSATDAEIIFIKLYYIQLIILLVFKKRKPKIGPYGTPFVNIYKS